jgi:hypothetical protein
MPTIGGKPGILEPNPNGTTGPHSFKDETGVEWFIEGYSRACGPSYVDCRSADGKAITVRPVAYLAASGLSIPADAPPAKRKPTAAEKKRAKEHAEEMTKAKLPFTHDHEQYAPEPDHFEGNLGANIAGDRLTADEQRAAIIAKHVR